MMVDQARQVFHNKILFCDIIGFSRLDPVSQAAAVAALNGAVNQTLSDLDIALEDGVIALPTGDGIVLNFLDPSFDVHLRAALAILSALSRVPSGTLGEGLRVGLNSDVDAWVLDINGRKNVVGNGVNMAQRVMDLGGHAQVLMHERVAHELSNFPVHSGKIFPLGEYSVKHAKRILISQYRDPANAAVSDMPPAAPASSAAHYMDAVRLHRQSDTLLELSLPMEAKAALPMVESLVEDQLDAIEAYQSLRLGCRWIVAEMLDNAFRHGRLEASDQVDLLLEGTKRGLRIQVRQPDVPEFDLSDAIKASREASSFLGMVFAGGMRFSHFRQAGRMAIEVDLPRDYRRPILEQEASLELGAVQEFAVEMSRVDEGTADEFRNVTTEAVRAARGNVPDLILDLRQVEYMSSRGLRGLTLANRDAGDDLRVSLRITRGTAMEEILAISRYDMVFRVIAD